MGSVVGHGTTEIYTGAQANRPCLRIDRNLRRCDADLLTSGGGDPGRLPRCNTDPVGTIEGTGDASPLKPWSDESGQVTVTRCVQSPKKHNC